MASERGEHGADDADGDDVGDDAGGDDADGDDAGGDDAGGDDAGGDDAGGTLDLGRLLRPLLKLGTRRQCISGNEDRSARASSHKAFSIILSFVLLSWTKHLASHLDSNGYRCLSNPRHGLMSRLRPPLSYVCPPTFLPSHAS